ncbi:tetratricopeptide repeat protein [Janthinobacterium sp. SUN176]|uniref:tetratricopeptide repeat protein n=1 Tax=unclassified Janthinobacterium TaxID=2610881 RepID=UPI0025AFFF3D|nr:MULTISPECIES: tetratricopeptide repeat protein [unclassified Janthinobacterium]MDN2700697.1 tetratricopeptide repeat protein [Janthinobacterium sp. SUN100]MDO8071127.1 tetratricopeptide repeat protein [Janthinobacterium sp. SUN176]
MKHRLLACTLAACCAHAGAAECPPYVKHTPGGDYTSEEDRSGLSVVEKFHFSRAVETLTQGMTTSLGGDISYTLEHFPNHHRALASMAKLGLRLKSAQPVGARYTVNCYFERAIAFAPHDVTARMVYGSYLLATGQDAAALEQLDAASRLAPDQATIQYNLGLMYVKKKEYDKASAHAQKAYALGFPLPGLKNKLKAAGKWKEPPPAVMEAKEAATAATEPAVPPVEQPSGE